jgi:alanyl-tRNA synthetase
MKSDIIREKFWEFFQKRGHLAMAPAPLVPENDPTSLFTTAGMQQFKRFYLHPKEAPALNLVTIQPCFRTSDIEEVGDSSHLTFFEMLGNFSFGGYFKKEAIAYAWEFLTDQKYLGIDKHRISATFFAGEKEIKADTASAEILGKIKGLSKIQPQGWADNFWSLGEEGTPGGPTVEFYVDGLEVWNLVFNEYILSQGKYLPAKVQGVDTGMGLERIASILQKVQNVYLTDLFALPHEKLHHFISQENVRTERIILDHIKSAVFLSYSGVIPSNKAAGYVLRRLIRKAMVAGKKLAAKEGFIKEVAIATIYTYKEVFPSLFKQRFQIVSAIEQEEKKFEKTLEKGLREFEKHKNHLSGEVAFDLYQTYGFPFELTCDLAKEAKIKIEKKEFEKAFLRHQALSRTASAGMFKGGLQSTGEQETKYHTATHLLLAALKRVLGPQIEQRGSNINAKRLRFDFNFDRKLNQKEIQQIEDLVNAKIQENLPVNCQEMSLQEARNRGATGIFHSKYGEKVKVYTIGSEENPFSREICRGPHVSATGKLGHFKIIKEESSAAGIRRIKAVLK